MPAKPLAGRTILVTSPKSAHGALKAGLQALGAKVMAVPVIRIAPPVSYRRLDAALRNLERYDAAVFASARAVASVFSRGRALGLHRLAAPPKVFAVGPRTARALLRKGWPAAVPKTHNAEALAGAMRKVQCLRIFMPRAAQGRQILQRRLRGLGARVDAVAAYRTVPEPGCAAGLRKAVESGRISAVAFTSGSAVDNFIKQLPASLRRRLFHDAAAASIGPVTSAALRRRSIKPAIEAPQATTAALCRAVCEHYRAGPR